jgi:general transcription factor 3C polypeptide 3 (transcription factor C subunit 4)
MRKNEIHNEDSNCRINLGFAKILYTNERYMDSKNMLVKILNLDPSKSNAWTIMALVHEVLKKHKKALDFFMIAALIKPKALRLWNSIAIKTFNLGMFIETINCYDLIVTNHKNSFTARRKKALLLWEMGCRNLAITSLNTLHIENIKKRNLDLQLINTLSRWYYKTKQKKHATKILIAGLRFESKSCKFSIVKILATIYIEKKSFHKAFDLIATALKSKKILWAIRMAILLSRINIYNLQNKTRII